MTKVLCFNSLKQVFQFLTEDEIEDNINDLRIYTKFTFKEDAIFSEFSASQLVDAHNWGHKHKSEPETQWVGK